MSLHPQKLPEIPEETARIAKILFPKGNKYMWLRDELDAIYKDEQFMALYPKSGQLAEQPWRLAMMSVIQYMENYTDRQAAEALKTRIDLKYALSLELIDPGFDFSVLSEFRSRLIQGGLEEVILTAILDICREKGLLKERGKQRTDSTHIEAAIRQINRFVCAIETLRAALNSLAVVVPDWLRARVPPTTQDMEMTGVIHQDLESKQLLPREHFVDTGYVDGEHLATSEKRYKIELIGPVAQNGNLHAKDAQAYENSKFLIDWENEVVTCPEGKESKKWTVKQNKDGKEEIRARFGQTECRACPARQLCTHAAVNPRQIVLRPKERHEAIQARRSEQTSKEFQKRYAKRSGIEGTISQGIRANDLRVSRFFGKDKTHLKHIFTAAAMNITRLFSWHMGDTPAITRLSRFASIAA